MIPVQGPSPTTPRAATSAPQSLMGARPAKSLVESPAALSASRATKFLCRSAATLLPTLSLMGAEGVQIVLMVVKLVLIMLEQWNVHLVIQTTDSSYLEHLVVIQIMRNIQIMLIVVLPVVL